MNIAIIDADLIGRKKHRFPNLACMKISGYYKELGHNISLKTNYYELEQFDKVFISKVFTDTPIEDNILRLNNVEYGGSGFFYDKAPNLPDNIEHHMPDYTLYDEWAHGQIDIGIKRKALKYYFDYSIGFVTRGCFRQCEFCINRNCTVVSKHSALNEFVDSNKKYICLLDDNIFGYGHRIDILSELIKTNKPFQFKQGLDIRLLNDELAEVLSKARYNEDYIFAFDNYDDKEIIENKINLWQKYNKTKGNNTKLYVLCGFDRNDKYDSDFWINDIIELFQRVYLLKKYNCKPYVMRYEKWQESPYRGIYINVAQWCNQPQFFFNMTYMEMCHKDNERKGGNSATKRYNDEFIIKNREVAEKYLLNKM